MTTKRTYPPTYLPARFWRHKVKQTLDAVRRKYNITGRFTQTDFYRICREENIRLMNVEIARSMSEIKGVFGACIRDNGKYYIYLRSFFNRNRRLCMFTAGHELGHYFLRHLETNLRANSNWSSNEQFEREADYFARLSLENGCEK